MAEAAGEGFLGERDFQRLLQAAAHSAGPCRDRALLHLFWHFGATVRQVTTLEVAHVNFLTGRIQWAGAPEGVLPPEALHALTAYVSLERDPHCPKLFAGRHGRPLTPAEVGRMFERLSGYSGVAVDPPGLRRAALFRLIRAQPLRALCTVRGARPSAGATAAGRALAR